ncbi:leukotriene-A4 hydrolase, partial [Tremellales sp. Uapishka_1]
MQTDQTPATGAVHRERDLATLSNYHQVLTRHIDLTWQIDWDKKLIGGIATLKMEALEDIKEVILDTSHLDIKKIEARNRALHYLVRHEEGRNEVIGQELVITLDKTVEKGETIGIAITYSTTEKCSAVGWLEPLQTKSGKYPYLYSQSQAIHARSLLPCQDTPAVKSTYSSKVTSILPVLMSGLRVSPPSEQVLEIGKKVEYVYDQPVAIPTYLIAIAAGELIYKPFKQLEGKQWRSGCWTEPLVMDDAFWEFSEDTANFVATAEEFTSPYKFGVYDFLILPDSFPYGGMENSCLTFATPALIAHDRSQVEVFAHEIAHSWFGNGIGCASWAHFWLNETGEDSFVFSSGETLMSLQIMMKLHGSAARDLSYIIGRRALRGSLADYENEPRFQQLVIPYRENEVSGRSTDDAFSSIPYDKGANFLLYLERTVGGLDAFLPYMKDYVKTFEGQSITTQQWQDHLFAYFQGLPNGDDYMRKLGKVDWDEWLHGSGPDICVDLQYDDTMSKPCLDLAERWNNARDDESFNTFSPRDIADFTSTQKVVFIEKLDTYEAFPPRLVAALEKLYQFNGSFNTEIKLRFLEVALKSGPEYAQDAADWVINKGRMKYCRPIYKLLYKVRPALAKKTFLDHASFYHPIARKMVAKDLGVKVDV